MEGIKTSYVDLHLNTLEVGYSSDYGEQRYVPEIILEVSNNLFKDQDTRRGGVQ